MLTFEGAYTALITPLTRDGLAVDLARLEEHIRFQSKGGVRGIVPCGTTGEAPTLEEHEHVAVIECAVSAGRPLGLQIIAIEHRLRISLAESIEPVASLIATMFGCFASLSTVSGEIATAALPGTL